MKAIDLLVAQFPIAINGPRTNDLIILNQKILLEVVRLYLVSLYPHIEICVSVSSLK